MGKMYDMLVFVGRFQPLHLAHLEIIKNALKHTDTVMILVGNSDEPRSFRNPFSFSERELMIRTACDDAGIPQRCVLVEPLLDFPHNNIRWIEQVNTIATTACDGEIGLTGYEKDHTSFYIKMFPDWDTVPFKGVHGGRMLNATEFREKMFLGASLDEAGDFTHMSKRIESILVRKDPDRIMRAADEVVATVAKMDGLPGSTLDFIDSFCTNDILSYLYVADTASEINRTRKTWGRGPFVTVDNVVVQAGSVLLVKRGNFPGKGLGALPGGYLEIGESLVDGAIRELVEETSIDLPKGVLKQNIITSECFSEVNRDERGRIITHAFYIDLDKEMDRMVSRNMPVTRTKVTGGDDAAKASWIPIAELKREKMYSDHYHIIHSMIEKAELMKRK